MHTDFTRYVVVNPIYVATSAKTLLRQCHAYGPWILLLHLTLLTMPSSLRDYVLHLVWLTVHCTG